MNWTVKRYSFAFATKNLKRLTLFYFLVFYVSCLFIFILLVLLFFLFFWFNVLWCFCSNYFIYQLLCLHIFTVFVYNLILHICVCVWTVEHFESRSSNAENPLDGKKDIFLFLPYLKKSIQISVAYNILSVNTPPSTVFSLNWVIRPN